MIYPIPGVVGFHRAGKGDLTYVVERRSGPGIGFRAGLLDFRTILLLEKALSDFSAFRFYILAGGKLLIAKKGE